MLQIQFWLMYRGHRVLTVNRPNWSAYCLYNIVFLFKTSSECQTQVLYKHITCSCGTRWTSNPRDLSVNSTRSKSSARRKETTFRSFGLRSEQTRCCCQCSVASLLNSSNCFSMHSTIADSNTSATLSLDDCQVWTVKGCPFCGGESKMKGSHWLSQWLLTQGCKTAPPVISSDSVMYQTKLLTTLFRKCIYYKV